MKDNTKIPESEHQKIIDLFLKGMSQKDIGALYGKSGDVIKLILRKHNVYAKDRPPRFSEEDIQNMIDMYLNGATLADLEVKYKTTDTTIMALFDKAGIQRRHSLYTCNENYFDTIDTEDKAYYLGLLYADGYNNVEHGVIKLTLQAEDKHILEKFKEVTENTTPLRFIENSKIKDTWKDCYEFSINNKRMSKVLEKHGVYQKKCLILKFPNWLDKSLYPHFIRGYFDGDGSISKKEHNSGSMSIISTDAFCSYLQGWIEATLNIETHIYISHTLETTTRTFMITRYDYCKIFFDYIYNDAHYYLKRKHDIYLNKYVQNVA